YGTAFESNARFRYLLAQGQTGLSVAFDLPTQIGLDSDHPLARGEVGRAGVAIDSLKDMEALFEAIPLDRVSTSMTINATAALLPGTRAGMEHDFDQRVSHPGGGLDRRAGGGLYPGERHRLR